VKVNDAVLQLKCKRRLALRLRRGGKGLACR
jgi:hypothetical protein